MKVALPKLTPAQDSLFLTLGSRALDNRLPHPFLGDDLSDQVLTEVGYDLARFPTLSAKRLDSRTKVFDVAVRTKRLDDMVRVFVQRHPEAVVVDLGAGLDGRAWRVGPPSTVDWYDVDYPVVADLRGKLLPESPNVHVVAADLTDPGWPRGIPNDRPAMLVADGLMLFMSHQDFVGLLNLLTKHFPSGELALNGYSTATAWLFRHTSAMVPIAEAMVNPGLRVPRQIECWVDGMTLVEEDFLTRAPEVAELPALARLASRLTGPSATASRVMRTMVLRYRF